jgi:hypothetical protein
MEYPDLDGPHGPMAVAYLCHVALASVAGATSGSGRLSA